MAMRRLNNLLHRPSAKVLYGGSIQRRSNNFRLFSNMTSLRRCRSTFIVPTLLFRCHSNGLALACSANQHRHGCGEYNFSTDTKNTGTISNDERWEIRFNELKEYKREHGDTLVPQRYAKFPQLGIWVVTQRAQYKRNQISDERIRRLNEVGFVWDPNEAAWEEMFAELKKYKQKYGDTLVPQYYEDNPKLGWWVSDQRKHYKYKQSGKASWLTDEQIARLNEIGFVWDPRGEAWQRN